MIAEIDKAGEDEIRRTRARIYVVSVDREPEEQAEQRPRRSKVNKKQCKAAIKTEAQACLRWYKYNVVYGVPSLARE